MRLTKKEIFFICALICIACIRFFFFIPKPPDYKHAVGKEVTIEGQVSDPPDVRLSNQRITLTPEGQQASILLTVSKYSEISYGDKIRARGILETPENFITSAGKEFDYNRYLAQQDIYFIIKNADVKVLSKGNGGLLQTALYRLRNAFMSHVEDIISPPESDLGNGLVLGTRGGFDDAQRNEFISTGTIHIVALSGYNVTIVAEGIMKALGFILSGTVSIMFGMVVVILFIIMAGATPTAVRAGIMTVIALFGRMTGRSYDAGRALAIAGLLMCAYDPRVLFNISFELSFLATFGVLFVTPKVLRFVMFLPGRFGFREDVATTIAATITVLPILLYSTGILSLVSLPANILILPFIPLTMLLVFLTGIAGFVSLQFSFPFGYAAHLLLLYILSTIHFFASLPFASVTIQGFPLFVTVILYGLLLWWVFRKKR